MNNTSANITYTGVWYPHYDIPTLGVLTTIAVLGLGNVGVIVTFSISKVLRTPFNYIVLGMAIGDVLMSNVTAVLEMVTILRLYVPMSRTWCSVKVFLRTLCLFLSILFITVVAVIRAVCGVRYHPIRFTKQYMIILVSIVYGVATVSATVWVLATETSVAVCLGSTTNPLPSFILAAVIFLLFLITITSYVVLGFSLKCRKSKSSIVGNNKSEILTARVAMTVGLMFIVCYLCPFLAAVIPLEQLVRPQGAILHAANIFNVLIFWPSALNPYIYLASNQTFRKIFMRPVSDLSHTSNQVGP